MNAAAMVVVLTTATLLAGCGSQCSNDHDEYYRYWNEGIEIEDLLVLKVGRAELNTSCNEIGYFSSSGGFQARDVHHLEPKIELQNHKIDGYVADFIEWRLLAIHGGVIDRVQYEIFPDDDRVFTHRAQLFLEEHDLGRNIRIEASVHLFGEQGDVAWTHASGAGHLDTSR